MMKKGLVSIITPCYNGERFIGRTIESVLAQTYPSWEMLIIDDGSKDSSIEVIRRYCETDSRIRLLTQKNAGSAAARNNGLRNCCGQYIALLDADDLWSPCFLEKQIACLKETNAICVSCAYNRIDENDNVIMHPTYPKKLITIKDMQTRNHIGCLSGLYDSEKYGIIYLKESLKSIRDDYAYWYDIVKLEGRAVGNPEILASYRVLDSSTTGNKKKLIKKQYQFYRSYLKLGVVKSGINVLRWGIAGLRKFSK